ncbi:MAG: hypothetical protein Kow00108_17060 [Calditrichia bacterium]
MSSGFIDLKNKIPVASDLKVRYGPDGVLFFDRNTGIHILMDEIKVPKERWSRAPRHVSIALTNACNLNCYHCFAPKHPASLQMEQLILWLHEMDQNGCLGVGFGGGEPTLYKKLPELCRYIIQHTGLAISMTTNAFGMTRQLAEDLKGNVHFIRVSMDGMGAVYEDIRHRSFTEFLKQLELIREIAPFGINYLVNRRTISQLNKVIPFAKETGASEILLLPEIPVNNSPGIDAGTLNGLRRWVYEYDDTVPLTISADYREGMPVFDPMPNETGLMAYAHIDANGILKRSSFDTSGIAIQREGFLKALESLQKTKEDS